MKKIFILMTLLTTTFVCAQEDLQEEEIVTQEAVLGCGCGNHEEEAVKQEEVEATASILACGSSSCSHDKDKDKN